MKKQSGMVLPVTLMILALLLISVLSLLNTNKVSSKIASSDSNKNLAFEAGESALRYVEGQIAIRTELLGFDGSGGLYGVDDIEPDPLLTASYSLTAPAITGLAAQPLYFVKYIGQYQPVTDSLTVGGYGSGTQPGLVSVFRITVKATGATLDTTAVLRSYYERRFL